MVTMNNLFKLRRHMSVEPTVLKEIFKIERSTLITLMLLETIILYILTPLLGNWIIAWYGITMSLSLWRLYNAYDFDRHPERNSFDVWHKKFVVQVWLTALMFSILALFAMPNLDAYYQLFTFIVLVGISSGAVKALSNDHRTAIGYLIIMLFPLMIEMLLLMRKDTYILAFLVVIYFFTQISILLHSYQQYMELKEKEDEIRRAKELLYQKQEVIQRFFEQAIEALVSYDENQNILDCNSSFLRLFELKREHVIGHKIKEIPNVILRAILLKSIEEGKNYQGEYLTSDGREFWIEAKCLPIRNLEGVIVGGIGIIKELTNEHKIKQELEYLATHDPLTSISNRRGFRRYMNAMIKEFEHQNHYSLLLYLDLNKFKIINDMYGHDTGDYVLIETATRLRHIVNSRCNVTRLGGDEFCLVIPFVSDTKQGVQKEIHRWVKRITEELNKPFIFRGRALDVGCSIGVVVIEPGDTQVEEIVKRADISMLHAKKNNQDHVTIYSKEMGEYYKRIYELQHDLESALKNNELELFFQPIMNIEKNKVRAAEVLVRWRHPKNGLLSPAEFLDVASKFGGLVEIDEWVLRETVKTLHRWKMKNILRISHLSVNIDARLLLKKDFVKQLVNMLDEYGIKHSELELEMTEASLVQRFKETKEVLDELYQNGIECTIDGFGKGYSSFYYLKKLSFSTVKFDKEFVQDVTDRIENIFLMRTLIDLSRKLNYHIIIEGIENERQREVVANIDPTLDYQGYLVSPPLPEEEFKSRFLTIASTDSTKSKGASNRTQ